MSETATDEDGPSDGRPPVACTLSDAEATARLDRVEADLLPHVVAVRERGDGLTVVLERSEAAFDAVTDLAWLESQCCAWARFSVELAPDRGPIRWHLRTDREAGVALFHDRLSALRSSLDLPG